MSAAVSQFALEARSVTAALGLGEHRREVLHAIDLRLRRGRWTSIVGPNGAGKSSLVRVLAGLLPHAGEVLLHGGALGSLGRRERARQLSWLGQNEGGADDLSVYDVAMLGRLPHRGWLAPPDEADQAAVERALRATQAWDWRERLLGQLSGGERQRVLLARALAVEADVLLMDEPIANLDPPHQADWLALARSLAAAGKTVVSVLHELSMALHADDMVVMAAGRIVHQGECGEPSTHEAVARVFDHRVRVRALDGQWVALATE